MNQRRTAWQIRIALMASMGLLGCRSTTEFLPGVGANPGQVVFAKERAAPKAAEASVLISDIQPVSFQPLVEEDATVAIPAGEDAAGVSSAREQAGIATVSMESPQNRLDQYVQIGLQQNPRILRARALYQAAECRVPQAASLPDPTLQMMAGLEPVQTAAGPQDFSLGINQKLPGKGKRESRATQAHLDAERALAELRTVELEVIQQIKVAYYQWYLSEGTSRIMRQQREQLQLIESVVQAMYEVKREVTQQDLLQVQVAGARLETELLKAQQQSESARLRLVRFMHVSTDTPLEVTDSLSVEQVTTDLNRLVQQAMASRPELQAQLWAIQRDRQAVDLAIREKYPDVTVGLNWIGVGNGGLSPVANGRDSLMLTMAMNLPVYQNRLQAGVREAEAKACASSYEYEAIKDDTVTQITDSFAAIASLKASLKLFRDEIVPRQQLSLEQAIDDYQVSKVDFLQMFENWNQLLQFQIQVLRFESDLQQQLATLARLVGEQDLAPSAETNSAL